MREIKEARAVEQDVATRIDRLKANTFDNWESMIVIDSSFMGEMERELEYVVTYLRPLRIGFLRGTLSENIPTAPLLFEDEWPRAA